jgi:hypothetical protein
VPKYGSEVKNRTFSIKLIFTDPIDADKFLKYLNESKVYIAATTSPRRFDDLKKTYYQFLSLSETEGMKT